MLRRLTLIALLSLTACGTPDPDQGPGDVTTSEAKALDDAREMIKDQPLPSETATAEASTATATPVSPAT
jgi:hypothetical protein